MVMVDPAIKQQILEDLEKMTPEQQRRTAEYAHAQLTLVSEPSSRPGVIPPRISDPEEGARIRKRVVERMQSNPIPEGAPRFTRDELHERG
jgi:hypothetical protein